MRRSMFLFFSFPIIFLLSFGAESNHRIQPEDLVYVGAFRLPDNNAGSYVKSWNYGGHSMTYYPQGALGTPALCFQGY